MSVRYDTPFLNTTGETVPAFAVMEVADPDGIDATKRTVKIIKPKTGGSGIYLVNGPTDVQAGIVGVSATGRNYRVLYDSAETPAAGQEWGAVPGSWQVAKGNAGFAIVGEWNGTTVRVVTGALTATSVLLRRCSDQKEIVADDVETDYDGKLSANIGKVVWLRESALLDADCWLIVEEVDCQADICPDPGAILEDCDDCESCWLLTPCTTGTAFVVRGPGWAQYNGRIVEWSNDNCYTVSVATDCSGAIDADVADIQASHSLCADCGDCARLEDCNSADIQYIRADQVGVNPAAVVGKIMRLDGGCWTIASVTFACVSTPRDIGFIYSGPYYNDCTACGCHRFLLCGTSTPPIFVHAATLGVGGATFDLSSLDFDDVVRVGTSQCLKYQGEEFTAANCATSIEIAIEEQYDDCSKCTAYTLVPLSAGCVDQTPITTNSDLSMYAVGDILVRAEDVSDICYRLTGTTPLSGSDIIFTVERKHDSCTQCQNPKYSLTPSCLAGCLDYCGSTPVLPTLITDHDLWQAVGLYIKYKGRCYLVGEAEQSDTVTEDQPISYKGPFATCAICEAEPICVEFLVRIDGEPKWLKIVHNFTLCDEVDGIGDCDPPP